MYTTKQMDFMRKFGLTHREMEVAESTAKGLSNKQTASMLCVTEKTIKFHSTNIYKKIGIKSRTQLVVLWLETVGKTTNTIVPQEAMRIAPGEELPVGGI